MPRSRAAMQRLQQAREAEQQDLSPEEEAALRRATAAEHQVEIAHASLELRAAGVRAQSQTALALEAIARRANPEFYARIEADARAKAREQAAEEMAEEQERSAAQRARTVRGRATIAAATVMQAAGRAGELLEQAKAASQRVKAVMPKVEFPRRRRSAARTASSPVVEGTVVEPTQAGTPREQEAARPAAQASSGHVMKFKDGFAVHMSSITEAAMGRAQVYNVKRVSNGWFITKPDGTAFTESEVLRARRLLGI